MRTPTPEAAHRLGELGLMTTALLLPLAFYLRTYDSTEVKYAILLWGALTMAFAWLWQGLSRGRFSAPASSWTALAPALGYGAWMVARFVFEPHKIGALPEFLVQLAMLAGFFAAFLGFAGARSAARFSALTVAAAWVVSLYGLAQFAGLDPAIWKGAFGTGALGIRAFSTLSNPYLCASFLAIAVPLALTLTLDDETPGPLRAAAYALLPVAALVAVLTGSAAGVAGFCASCVVFGAVLAAALRTRAALKAAALAVFVAAAAGAGAWMTSPEDDSGTKLARRETWSYASEFRRLTAAAELRMLAERPLAGFGPGSFSLEYPRFRPVEILKLEGGHSTMTYHPELPLLGAAVELGLIGAALWLWLFGASLWSGFSGAAALRRAGALPESVYAAGFTGAAAGALVLSHFGWAGYAPSTGWFVWPLAGLAAGLAPLASRRAAVSVFPLPVSESVRNALYAPSLLAFAGLSLLPGAWMRSEVELNKAIFFVNDKNLPQAVAQFEGVRPGSRSYLLAQYFKGNTLNDMGRHEEALAAYDRLQEQAPDYILVHAARGAAYAKLGDWKAAAAERARQADLDPLFLENLVAWAEAARASGDLEQARVAAAKAEALAPGDPAVKLQIAANAVVERRGGPKKVNGHGVARKPR